MHTQEWQSLQNWFQLQTQLEKLYRIYLDRKYNGHSILTTSRRQSAQSSGLCRYGIKSVISRQYAHL